MRRAVLEVMTRCLLRDRAALAMSFVLPGVVFVIFALIFSGASGGTVTVHLAIADEIATEQSRRLIAAILEEPRIVRVGPDAKDETAVRILVRSGTADVGIVVRRDARPLDDLSGAGPAPLVLVADPAREIAYTLVQGVLQRAYFAALPEAPLRAIAGTLDARLVPFTAEQKARLAAGLDAMAKGDGTGGGQGLGIDGVITRVNALEGGRAPTAVTYYAGAVAILFLMFAALNGAIGWVDERESGLLDRLAQGPGGVGVLIDGRFLFLTLHGLLQACIIFAVAWAAFGVDVPANALPWLATTLAAAVASAGLALAFVTMCRTKQQAQTLGQMLILVVSAVGGSMVPRYLMPPSIQALGWGTPNTWAIEAYSGVFLRGAGWPDLAVPLAVLAGIGLVGLTVAHIAARRSV